MLVARQTALGSGVELSGIMEESGGTGEVQAYLGEVELEGLTCYWETEYRRLDSQPTPIRVKGRLRENVKFWKEVLEAPVFVIETIETGYVLLSNQFQPHFPDVTIRRRYTMRSSSARALLTC